jgi:hypothetical protein
MSSPTKQSTRPLNKKGRRAPGSLISFRDFKKCQSRSGDRWPRLQGAGGKSELRRAGWSLTATGGDPKESATENIPPRAYRGVRVKRRGKSSPLSGRPGRHGKPHPEQDQIGEREEWPARGSRVRSLEATGNCCPRLMITIFRRVTGGRNRTRLTIYSDTFKSPWP